MRKLLIYIALLPLIISSATVFATTFTTTTLNVENMTCSLCPYTLKKVLMKVKGVKSAGVDINTRIAIIQYDPNITSPNALIQATTNAGYPSKLSR